MPSYSFNNEYTLFRKLPSSSSIAQRLGVIMNFDRFRWAMSAFEMLKSNGLNNISDSELRGLISVYYDDDVHHILQALLDIENSFHTDIVPVLKAEFEGFKFKKYARPYDPKAFIAKREVTSYFRLFRDNREGIAAPAEEAFI